MKKQFICILLMCVFSFFSYDLRAESAAIDFLQSTGKIYSVIAVIVIVLIGIGLFLYSMDKKLTKLENQINNE